MAPDEVLDRLRKVAGEDTDVEVLMISRATVCHGHRCGPWSADVRHPVVQAADMKG
jgi:hypothetical protein